MDWVLVAQASSLLSCLAYHAFFAVLSLPFALLAAFGIVPKQRGESQKGQVTFYEGSAYHSRKQPKENSFRYKVRCAVLDLDNPPEWFKQRQAADHLTADQARKFAGTTGPVRLLTNPEAAGYIQNPISVYYCYSHDRKLQRCIAEVTNTPWGERVSFVFRPEGEAVQKALHVSPFMDMKNTWHLQATDPQEALKLVVKASHPEMGNYFHADLIASKATCGPSTCNEEASLMCLLQYGFMPHRVALLIYWQALKLLWKGVPFYSPPNKEYQQRLQADTQHTHPRNGTTGAHFVWCPAKSWPWNAS